MPELRKDLVFNRWVIIATERARRPGNFIDSSENYFDEEAPCSFCADKDPAIYTHKGGARSGWAVKVVPSGSPRLVEGDSVKRRDQGLYFLMNNYGVHEVVVETPKHIANMADLDEKQIGHVIETYAVRFAALENNANLQYVIAYKNYGWAAGGRRIGHARSQIIAAPVNPLRVKGKLTGAKQYFDLHERCIYCDLVRQETSDGQRLIFQTENFVATAPFAPRFPFEVWIVPKPHHCDFHRGVQGYEQELAGVMKTLLQKLKIGLEDPAYNYVLHTAPFHREQRWDRWRTIEDDYHWHIEVIPRINRPAGFEKGSGFYICPIPPEAAAEYLREVEV